MRTEYVGLNMFLFFVDRLAQTCLEWLIKLVAMGPTRCQHILDQHSEKLSPVKKGAEEKLQNAIQLSPPSQALYAKVAGRTSEACVPTTDDLTKYETCMKGRLSMVTSAGKRLSKQINKEYEERKAAEDKARKNAEMQHQAKLAEQAKQAAASNMATEAVGGGNNEPKEVLPEVNGCSTHMCESIAHFLQLKGISSDIAISGGLDRGIASALVTTHFLPTAGTASCDDHDKLTANEVLESALNLIPVLLVANDDNASAASDCAQKGPPWLGPLKERLQQTTTRAAMMTPDKGTLSEFVFGYKNNDGLNEMMSLLDALASSTYQVASMFPEPAQAQVLKALRSVVLHLYETHSFFCGTYDMLTGRVIHCISGCRFIAGIPIDKAFSCFQKANNKDVSTTVDLASWLRKECSLETIMEEGFYVLLQQGDVFVVPPVFFMIEASLGIGDAVLVSYPFMPAVRTLQPNRHLNGIGQAVLITVCSICGLVTHN